MLKRMFLRLMAALPLVVVGFVDYSVYVSLGKTWGFSVGPCFISIDKDGDSWRGWWPWTPKSGQFLTDFSFEWSSREGFRDLAYKPLADFTD